MSRAAWLEPHSEFEGVGAHELNFRYDHVDGGEWVEDLRAFAVSSDAPTLPVASRMLAASAIGVRFDGADISHHQDDAGPIDWSQLRSSSWWCATKATQSTGYVDPTFTAHRVQMAAQGFTHRLFYHWLSSTTDPVAQALHFLETVGDWHDGEGAFLDAEEAGIAVAGCLAWHEVVQRERRRKNGTYTGAYVAGGTIWQSTRLRECGPMHLAAYTTEAKALALPGMKSYPWDAWQYSSNGPVPGITGRCDMNRIDNRAAFDLACGVNASPQPQPTPPQGGDEMALLLTNSQAGKYGNVNESWWVLMDDGSKRHVPTLAELGARSQNPVQKCDDAMLDGIPDYVPGAGGTTDSLARQGVLDMQDDFQTLKGKLKDAGT